MGLRDRTMDPSRLANSGQHSQLTRRAARRGQGGRLTTLNFRPGAVTTLNLGHVSIFLSSNISRKQTRQYRKSTKEATSGKRCESHHMYADDTQVYIVLTITIGYT